MATPKKAAPVKKTTAKKATPTKKGVAKKATPAKKTPPKNLIWPDVKLAVPDFFAPQEKKNKITSKQREALIFKARVKTSYTANVAGSTFQSNGTNSLADLLRSLYTFTIPTGIFPVAVRYVSPSRNMFVVERPPRIARIQYIPKVKRSITGLNSSSTRTYDIPIPWTLTFLKFKNISINPYIVLENIHVLCTSGPLGFDGFDKTVCLMPMPNNMTNYPCLEDYQATKELKRLMSIKDITVSDIVNRLINIPWEGRFNNDASSTCNLGFLPYVLKEKLLDCSDGFAAPWKDTFEAWQSLSIDDITDWDAPSSNSCIGYSHDIGKATVATVIKRLEYPFSISDTSNEYPLTNAYATLRKAITNQRYYE